MQMSATKDMATALESIKKKMSLKKLVVALVILVVIAGIAGIGITFAEYALEMRAHKVQAEMIAQQAETAGISLISEEEAEKVAFHTAGIDASRANWTVSYLDNEYGMYAYDVSFIHGAYKYNMEIDAVKGTIIENEVDSLLD